MASINILPPALASQIAAGEVVERPASATKELIENALDAKASRCDVACVGGGIVELSVRDDGVGMSEQDAALCIERHATSKLTAFSDLGSLATFGFRGEALPSIASVSRFSLCTRPQTLDYGCRVEVTGGASLTVRREGMPVGTTVVVKDLFFNVPARRKFLRSTGTESAHVSAVVDGAALARPEVTFTLERDGRRVKELLRTGSRRERIIQLLGDEPLTEVRGERGPLRLEAHLSRPERARPGATSLWLLVNGRVVRDRMIAATVAQAYGTALSAGNYPRGVVYLDLPVEMVDVNVHPQKTEVRFVDPRALGDAVFTIVSKVLGAAFNLSFAARGRQRPSANPAPPDQLPVERGFVPGDGHMAARPRIDPWVLAAPSGAAATDGGSVQKPGAPARVSLERLSPMNRETEQAPRGQSDEHGTPAEHRIVGPRTGFSPSLVGAALTSSTQGLSESAELDPQISAEMEEPAPVTMINPPLELIRATAPELASLARPSDAPQQDRATDAPRMRLLGQVRRSMWICEGEQGLYVFDQHALDESVLAAQYLMQFRTNTTASETLLFPSLIEVSSREAAVVEEHGELLGRLGFELRMRGKDRLSIHAVPRVLKRANPEHIARDSLLELIEPRTGTLEDRAERAIAAMACHAAIQRGEEIPSSQAQAVLATVDESSLPGRTKHGRPLLAKLEWTELERTNRAERGA